MRSSEPPTSSGHRCPPPIPASFKPALSADSLSVPIPILGGRIGIEVMGIMNIFKRAERRFYQGI